MSKKKLLAIVLTLVMVLSLIPVTAVYADLNPDGSPLHNKSVTDNGDGTYKLELTVTGDADDQTESNSHVNVLIVYDESSSMQNDNPSRRDYAEDAMYTLVNGLVGYQAQGVDIYAACIGFGTGTNIRSGWTNSLSAILALFDQDVDGVTNNGSHGNYGYNGTAWAAALTLAGNLLGQNTTEQPGLERLNRNGYPTFVILVTDGGPTVSDGNTTTVPGSTVPWTSYRVHYNAASGPALSIQSKDNTTLYGIYAFGTDANLLDDLMYYANTGTHRTVDGQSVNNAPTSGQNHDFGDDEGADKYYNASNAAALNTAISSIFNEIVQAMGITEVSISDGTTNQVKTSTGSVSELLEVDESSYQYWMSIPLDSNNQFKRNKNVNGSAAELIYTVADNGDGTCTITWTEGGSAKTVTVDGSVSAAGQFKFEWTKDKFPNDFYEYAPNDAALNKTTGAVDWDLSNVNTLLDGVTYSVTFDVYPSQETLDYVADIKNDPGENGAWKNLDSAIQKYIDVNGNLLTNTSASLTYKDTRENPANEHSATFKNPDPVSNSAVEQLAVAKKWENELDEREQPPVTLKVTRDGDPVYTVTLGPNAEDPEKNWKDKVYISVGIIKGGKVLAGSEGHDFTFVEEPGESGVTFYWELNVPTVHPMLIDNVLTMLVKVDEKHPAPSGATTYDINGATYYVDNETVALTAVNERRSSVNLKKVVEAEEGTTIPDATFPFTINIVDSLAPDTAPTETEDPNHNSDYWVWISVRDMSETDDPDKAPAVLEGVTGATSAGGGWYYAPSGTDITVQVKDGYSIRFNNLPTGSTYTITEGTLPSNFTFKDAKIEVIEGDGTTDSFKGGQTSTGEVETTNTIYSITYTNEYALVDVSVDKVWDDSSNQNGLRPESLELTLSGAPEGTKIPEPKITKSEDGNTWTYTWSALPKTDANGKELTYTVTEAKVPSGYICEKTSAENGGTITNKLDAVWGDPPVKKIIEGKPSKDETFTFVLKAVSTTAEGLTGKMPMPKAAEGAQEMTVDITGEGETEFGEFALVVPGTYTYTITEKAGTAVGYTYSTESHTIVYTVSNNADGSLKCVKTVDGVEITGNETDEANVSKFSFTNKYEMPLVDVAVVKEWEDGDNADNTRPTEVTITLLANGKATDKTLKLSEDNKWSGIFEGLDKLDEKGKEIEYTVEETKVPTDYTAKVSGDAKNGFQVTNTLQTPDTGDHSQLILWSGILIVSLLGIALLAVIKRRKPSKHSR